METAEFRLGVWDLAGAIDALIAMEDGAPGPVVDVPGLKEAVVAYLAALDEDAYLSACARLTRLYLTDEAVAAGRGIASVRRLAEWLAAQGLDR